jgi:predicted RNase H-like nuclease (RuvC/YqgF family)
MSKVPYWVHKQNEALMRASYESEISDYLRRIKALERENEKLKRELEELKQQNEELKVKVSSLESILAQKEKT